MSSPVSAILSSPSCGINRHDESDQKVLGPRTKRGGRLGRSRFSMYRYRLIDEETCRRWSSRRTRTSAPTSSCVLARLQHRDDERRGVVEGLNICMRPSTHRHRSLVSESAIAPTHSLGATNSRPRQRVGKTYAVRRPYAKYANGTAPAELVSITATAHLTFEPRTSLAGRRARSTRAATLSTPSTAPTRTISLRARGDRSLHLFLPTTSTLTRLSPL